MRICISQLNPVVGAIQSNIEKIIREIEYAKSGHADLVVFPEMAICGYFPGDLLLDEHFIETVSNGLDCIIKASSDIAVIVGLPRKDTVHQDKPLCNSAAIIVNGKLMGFQDKALLPTYDVFDERRYFQPAHKEKVWEIAGKKIGITICEDIWAFSGKARQEKYVHDPLIAFEKNPIDLLVNISASPYSAEKIAVRKEITQKAALRLKCHVLLCNQIGAQDGIIYDGTSIFVSPQGELLFQAASFLEESSIIDMTTQKAFTAPVVGLTAELFAALVLGVKDYFKKRGFKKACLGLSGGVDSALVACIACAALGKENVLGVLLPSRFTSKESTEDALHVASNLGMETIELTIEKSFQASLDTLAPLIEGKPFDITEENIQARIRGMLLMAISNKTGRLLLNTSNKSELACGYCTLYGDSCGAIAVIGDLLKTEVYRIAEWIMHTFGWIPPCILQKAPTAELRHNQKDSDSLPDYSILDPIIEEHVVNMLPNDAIAKKLNCSLGQVNDIILKIHSNEYKRRQCPFALRVSEKAFSCGRVVPIVHHFYH